MKLDLIKPGRPAQRADGVELHEIAVKYLVIEQSEPHLPVLTSMRRYS